MSLRDLIAKLVDAGVDPIDAGAIIAEAAIAGAGSSKNQRSAGAIRQERHRRNKASQVTLSDGMSPPLKMSPHTPLENTPPNSQSSLRSDCEPAPSAKQKPTPEKILSEFVSEKTAADVVAHRKALRKPLTPRAAELLAKSLAASGDAERAAATMIERGWQGYRADWDGATSNARDGPRRNRGWAAAILGSSMGLQNGTPGEENRDRKVIPLISTVGEVGGRTSGYDDSGLFGNPVGIPDRRSR